MYKTTEIDKKYKKLKIILFILILFFSGVVFGKFISNIINTEALLLILVLFSHLSYCILLFYRLDNGLEKSDNYGYIDED